MYVHTLFHHGKNIIINKEYKETHPSVLLISNILPSAKWNLVIKHQLI